jgi:diguanylate cyclase (GGDEF)-like protein/PAS domain S-box-containing protein
MALSRTDTGSQPSAMKGRGGEGGGGANAGRLAVLPEALQRYEEAVFRIAPDGIIEPANPVAKEFGARLPEADLARLRLTAAASQSAGRALVDMVDVGETGNQQNLQVTLVPLSDNRGTLLFVRDLTLDNSLRVALVDSRRRYKDFIEISTDFTWETGPAGRFAFVPPRGALGYTADALMALEPKSLVVTKSTTGDDVPFLTPRRIENEETWLRRSDGRTACVIISAMPLRAKDGTWLGARGVCRDVTETRDRESTLARVRNRERVFTRIVRAFRDEVNPEAMLLVAAEALSKGLGAEDCHIFRTTVPEPGSEDQSSPTPGFQPVARYGAMEAEQAGPVLATIAGGAGAVEVLLGGKQVLAAPARYRNNANGAVVLWRDVERGAWSDDDRLLIGDIANQVGITIEQHTHHEHVLRISRTDALTGLLNRGAFIDSLRRFLSRLTREGGQGVLMYVDLDNFKQVNDTRGHQAGDEVLVGVRDVLIEHTRPTDLVARLGGDEFAIWLNRADLTTAKKRANQFLDTMKPMSKKLSAAEKPLGMSIGISVWTPETGEDLDSLLARGDAAMYDAKRGGKGTFTIAPPAAPKTRA